MSDHDILARARLHYQYGGPEGVHGHLTGRRAVLAAKLLSQLCQDKYDYLDHVDAGDLTIGASWNRADVVKVKSVVIHDVSDTGEQS